MVKVPLDGDGCVPNLFHYLWAKNEDGRSCPGVYVPDTVVYKYRQPAYWYFTSREADPQIKMKNKVNLGNSKVEEAFIFKKSASCDAICYYLAPNTQSDNGGTTIEHFDTESLREFLYFREKENNGILQRFLEPKCPNNAVYRAIWSPNVFLAERRTNVHLLDDKKLPLHKRCVTYEGEEYLSTTVPVTDTMLGVSISRICNNIVAHVSNVTDGALQIGSMVLHFKVDKNDRIWLLWCSSIRLASTSTAMPSPSSRQSPKRKKDKEDSKRMDRERGGMANTGGGGGGGGSNSAGAGLTVPLSIEHVFSVPDHAKRYMYANKLPNVPNQSLRKVLQCPSCLKRISPEQRCECTYKMVTDYLDQQQIEASYLGTTTATVGSTSGSFQEGQVPEVLLRLHPHLSYQHYKLLRKDPLFQYSRMTVCDVCFCQYAKNIGEAFPDMPKLAETTGSLGMTASAAMMSRDRRKEREAEILRQMKEDEQRERDKISKMVMRTRRSQSVTSQFGAARSTRLAEAYVASVTSSSLLKEFENKQISKMRASLGRDIIESLRAGAVSAPPGLEPSKMAFEKEDSSAAAQNSNIKDLSISGLQEDLDKRFSLLEDGEDSILRRLGIKQNTSLKSAVKSSSTNSSPSNSPLKARKQARKDAAARSLSPQSRADNSDNINNSAADGEVEIPKKAVTASADPSRKTWSQQQQKKKSQKSSKKTSSSAKPAADKKAAVNSKKKPTKGNKEEGSDNDEEEYDEQGKVPMSRAAEIEARPFAAKISEDEMRQPPARPEFVPALDFRVKRALPPPPPPEKSKSPDRKSPSTSPNNNNNKQQLSPNSPPKTNSPQK